jgi:hypothetical protein
MKRPVLSFILFSVAAASTIAQPTDAIQRLVLNPMAVTRIPVAMDRLTTVRFPSPVAALESGLVGTEPHPEALFLLSFQSGNSFFSLRALVRNTNTTLNVTWKAQTYVFELVESRNPWLSVILDPPAEPASSSASRPVTSSRLLGLLDTAKAYGFLRQQNPAAVAGVEVARPFTRHDYGGYTIVIEEVFRFEREDTLVFRISVSNKTSVAIQFVPQSLMVRVGQRFYFQSITDATGILPPTDAVPIYFAVTGSPDGSLNALSPRNDFMVLLNRLEPPAPLDPAPRVQSSLTPSPTPPVYRPVIVSKQPPNSVPPIQRRPVTPVYPTPPPMRTNRPPPARYWLPSPVPVITPSPPVQSAAVSLGAEPPPPPPPNATTTP